jgi:hypothetical protein
MLTGSPDDRLDLSRGEETSTRIPGNCNQPGSSLFVVLSPKWSTPSTLLAQASVQGDRSIGQFGPDLSQGPCSIRICPLQHSLRTISILDFRLGTGRIRRSTDRSVLPHDRTCRTIRTYRPGGTCPRGNRGKTHLDLIRSIDRSAGGEEMKKSTTKTIGREKGCSFVRNSPIRLTRMGETTESHFA